jgi:ABC-type Fe3+/spermidine/putrescine transport system ATPase subunit
MIFPLLPALLDRPAHERGMAMVFQDCALFPHMNVHDNVGYGLRLAKVPRSELARRRPFVASGPAAHLG